MQLELQRVGCTFHFELKEDILHITATDGAKKWNTCIWEPLTFTLANITMNPKDLFDLFRLCSIHACTNVSFICDDFNDVRTITVTIQPDTIPFKQPITLSRVIEPTLDKKEQQLVERVSQLESSINALTKRLDALVSENKVRNDLLAFVSETMEPSQGAEMFHNVYWAFRSWYPTKFSEEYSHTWQHLMNVFRANGYTVMCGTFTKCSNQNCKDVDTHRLKGFFKRLH